MPNGAYEEVLLPMKKACVFLTLLLLCAGVLSASVRLVLDVGPIYTNFTNHLNKNSERSIHEENLFGVNLALRAEFIKNFGVYAMTNFAFGNNYWEHWSYADSYGGYRVKDTFVYAIDSQFGFFYAFKPRPKLEIALGAGLGIGGNGFTRKIRKIKQNVNCTNIGFGLNADVSYMFNKLVGIYGGIADTIYAPVAVSTKFEGATESKIRRGQDVRYDGIGPVSNSFSIKAGVQFVF